MSIAMLRQSTPIPSTATEMASRLSRCTLSATRLRPSAPIRRMPALVTHFSITRPAFDVSSNDQKVTEKNAEDLHLSKASAKDKAQSLIDALPGSSLISKSAILSAGTGISIWAISSELYVFNEESIVAFCVLGAFTTIFWYGGPLYKQWAETQITKIKDIMNTAKAGHADAVKTRMEDVKPLGNVVEITKQLFEVSKETTRLEAQAYELEQKTALAAEAKTVLDSWVRYEGQVKTRQQRELAESVIAKIGKELENPKVLQQILQQSVADVEKVVASKAQ